MITIEQLRELKAKATSAPWEKSEISSEEEYYQRWIYIGPAMIGCDRYGNNEELEQSKNDAAYIAALPDIAQLALDLAKENEELKAK